MSKDPFGGIPRSGGPWPPLGDMVHVLDDYHDNWRTAMSAGGGYVFYDDYGTDRCKIIQWRQKEATDE